MKFRTVTARCAALVIAFSLLSFFAEARFPQPNAEYQARRTKLRTQLDGPLVLFAYTSREDSSEFAVFFQEPNFYYLTGDSEPDAAIVLLPDSAQPGEAKGHAKSFTCRRAIYAWKNGMARKWARTIRALRRRPDSKPFVPTPN